MIFVPKVTVFKNKLQKIKQEPLKQDMGMLGKSL